MDFEQSNISATEEMEHAVNIKKGRGGGEGEAVYFFQGSPIRDSQDVHQIKAKSKKNISSSSSSLSPYNQYPYV